MDNFTCFIPYKKKIAQSTIVLCGVKMVNITSIIIIVESILILDGIKNMNQS